MSALILQAEGVGGPVNYFGLTPITGRREQEICSAVKCEKFVDQTLAKAEAKLNEWKKANASAVAIIAQIIEMPSTDPGGCVIRVEYENSEE